MLIEGLRNRSEMPGLVKVLDALDRTIGRYNCANSRPAGAAPQQTAKQSMNLLVHYLTFHVSLYTLERTKFMAGTSRRYDATRDVLLTGRQKKAKNLVHHTRLAAGVGALYSSGLVLFRK